MAKISEIQAESGVLEGTASLINDVSFTPSGGNNGVLADGGLNYLKINSFAVPSGTTKILFFVKKKVPNATNSSLFISYIGSQDPQYGVVSQPLINEGLHSIEVTTLPYDANNILVLDGPFMTYDRIEFHDNSVVSSGSDIIVPSGSTLSKNSGVSKFQNTGEAIPIGSTITFSPTFNPSYSGTLTPTCNKGAFAQSGSNWVLTLAAEIAASELFDINFTLSTFIKKSTVLTFDIVSVVGFTENNLTNDTATATFTPTADLSIVEVSKSSVGFSVNITNNGTDAIDSEQVILVKANGTNLPTGSNLTANSAKGIFSGSDWINGVALTLSSELAIGETFLIEFAFVAAVNTNYSSTTSAVWQSSITDDVSSNNSIIINHTPSVLLPPNAPILSTVLAAYSGDAQSGTASEAGTILMLLNGNVVGQTTTSGVNNTWNIVCVNAGLYTFKLTNANGTSLASTGVAIVNRPSANTINDAVSTNTNSKQENSKFFTSKNLLITGGLILIVALLYWAFAAGDEE